MKKNKELSLHGLDPGTEEYKRVEAILIKRFCDSVVRDLKPDLKERRNERENQ